MSGLSRFFYAGLVAAAALVMAPQTSFALDGIGGWSGAPSVRRGAACDGYGECTRGGSVYREEALRGNGKRRVTAERTRKHRDVRRQEWRGDDWGEYNRDGRRKKQYYRSNPDVYIDLQIGRPQYYEPRYVPRRTIVLSQAHVNWCYNRYISYREWDNTWKPYVGARKQCYSPYS